MDAEKAKEVFKAMGNEASYARPAQLQEWVTSATAHWGPVIKESGYACLPAGHHAKDTTLFNGVIDQESQRRLGSRQIGGRAVCLISIEKGGNSQCVPACENIVVALGFNTPVSCGQ